jgi:D-arginine dehydrogenase
VSRPADGCDVVVVGAGIAGASLGYELAADRTVVVVEAESEPGRHTTGRSAAAFLESYGPAPVRLLTAASRAFLDDPPDGFPRPLLRPRPNLVVAPEADADALRAAAATLAAEAPVELVDAAEARRLCPALRPDWLAAAMVERTAADIDVAGLHQGYLAGLRRRGGHLVTGAAVRELRPETGRWRVRTAAGASWLTPLVVDAAGAWADAVAQAAGLAPLGVAPAARNVFVVPAPAGADVRSWPLVDDYAETFYFKPEGDGLLCSAADEVPAPPGDARVDPVQVARAIEAINAATTLGIRHVRRSWAGLRSFVPDRVPVAGLEPGAPGFGWLAGQGGYGIQTAPALAVYAAAVLTGRPLPADLRSRGLTAAALAPARLRPAGG